MANLTPNYSLAKPIATESYDINVPNTNMDIIDTNMKRIDNTAINKNYLINGGFDIWQRGASQTEFGYGSDDRWLNENIGSTKVHSRQEFAPGQADVPDNLKYFSKTIVTSVSGIANRCNKRQRIEDVRTLAGKTATLSFWAKADASKNIAIEFIQVFGSGGSVVVTGIGSQKVTLTTDWQRFIITVNIPSISGKTIGDDSYLAVNFWYDAGTFEDDRTDGLGQQSGTFDIAQVKL